MLGVWVSLLWVAAWARVPVEGATSQADVSTLNVLYGSFNSPSQLTGWSSGGGDPCGQSWKGITCSGSDVTKVVLSKLGLNGSLGYKLADMVSLINFDVSNNNIGAGGQLPYGFPPNLQRLDLSGNQFGGVLPYSFSQMSSLKYLNVGHNNLQGSLNDMFSNHTSLLTMDLSSNNFSGTLPQSFSTLSSLSSLFLQNNHFTGSLDVLVKLPLVNLNIMHNKFNGTIPDQLKHVKNFQSDSISWGSPGTSHSSPQSPSGHKMNPGQRSSDNTGLSTGRGQGKSGIGVGVIAGIIVAGLLIGFLIAFFFVKKKQKAPSKKKILKIDQRHDHTPIETSVVAEMKPNQTFLQTGTTAMQAASSSSNLKPPPIDQHKSFHEDEFSNNAAMPKNYKSITNATAYSVADLQLATGSFNSENLIGEGSFGRVYRAQFDDRRVVAVKKLNASALPNQTPEYFLEMVSSLSQLRHPNVNELVGYCCEHGQHLLVFEFQKNGSLQDLLHLSDEYSRPLTWNTRIKIALGTARALEYLHEVCSPSIVHKNFKSANILLDHELNPQLSDCGLSNLVINTERQASDRNMGFGYSAPEVVMSGQYTLKSDVYSFGVVMLELLTARKPFDSLRPRSEQSLVRWATPQLHDIDALDKMVDPALKGLYAAKSLSRFADIIALCVQPEPEFRPPMSEVVQALVRLVQRANMSRRMGSADEMETPRRADDTDRHDTF